MSKEVEKAKQRYLKRFLSKTKDAKGEELEVINPKIKGNNNKRYEQIKIKVLKSFIKSKIFSSQLRGDEYIIIEGTQLSTYLSSKDLDHRVLIERPFDERMKDIMKRDNLTKEEFIEREEYDKKKKPIDGKNNINVQNNINVDINNVVEIILNKLKCKEIDR